LPSTGGYFVYLIIGIIIYLYLSYCQQAIAKNLDTPRPWLAWIPLLNIYLLNKMIGKGIGWTILCFLPVINVVVFIIIAFKLVRVCGRSWVYGLLLLIPVVSYVILWILAFGGSGDAAQSSPAA
jgi:hypothetical protein